MMWTKNLFFLVHMYSCLLSQSLLNVVQTVKSNLSDVNGILRVCSGDLLSITCTHNNTASGVTQWIVSNSTTTICSEPVSHCKSGPSDDTCGPFNVTVYILNECSDPPFTSTVQAIATEALNGAVVECLDKGGKTIDSLVGNLTIRIQDSPSVPGPLFMNILRGVLNVTWSPPSNGSTVDEYLFGVTGEGCGCVSMNVSGDTTSVTCSGWTAAGQNCSYEVKTLFQECVSQPASENVLMKVPPPPIEVFVTPTYSSSGSFRYIDVEFVGVESILISANICADINYTVMIGALEFTGVTCNTTNYCALRVTGSQLATVEGLFNVSVLASNAVGSGPPVAFPIPVSAKLIADEIVKVQIDVVASIAQCHLLKLFPETPNFVCSMTYGPASNSCELYTNSSTLVIGKPGDSVLIHLINGLDSVTDFCYTVSLSYGHTTLTVEGLLNSTCNATELGGPPMFINGSGKVAVSNGEVNYTGVKLGSLAVLSCHENFKPEYGTEPRVCLSDGSWSNGEQNCVQKQGFVQGLEIGISAAVFALLVVTVLVVIVIVIIVWRRSNKFKNNVSSLNQTGNGSGEGNDSTSQHYQVLRPKFGDLKSSTLSSCSLEQDKEFPVYSSLSHTIYSEPLGSDKAAELSENAYAEPLQVPLHERTKSCPPLTRLQLSTTKPSNKQTPSTTLPSSDYSEVADALPNSGKFRKIGTRSYTLS